MRGHVEGGLYVAGSRASHHMAAIIPALETGSKMWLLSLLSMSFFPSDIFLPFFSSFFSFFTTLSSYLLLYWPLECVRVVIHGSSFCPCKHLFSLLFPPLCSVVIKEASR